MLRALRSTARSCPKKSSLARPPPHNGARARPLVVRSAEKSRHTAVVPSIIEGAVGRYRRATGFQCAEPQQPQPPRARKSRDNCPLTLSLRACCGGFLWPTTASQLTDSPAERQGVVGIDSETAQLPVQTSRPANACWDVVIIPLSTVEEQQHHTPCGHAPDIPATLFIVTVTSGRRDRTERRQRRQRALPPVCGVLPWVKGESRRRYCCSTYRDTPETPAPRREILSRWHNKKPPTYIPGVHDGTVSSSVNQQQVCLYTIALSVGMGMEVHRDSLPSSCTSGHIILFIGDVLQQSFLIITSRGKQPRGWE